MRSILVAAVAAGALVATPALANDDSSISVTTGVDFSSGDYGAAENTDILVVPFSVRYKTGNLRLSATLPWLRIDGSSGVLGGSTGPDPLNPNAPRTTRDGLGDLSLGVAYMIPEETLGFGLDLSARVKLPTASESKNLGTGKTDFSLGAEVSKTFGAITPFASVGYRIPGDPTGTNLNNAWNASAGASVAVGKTILIASYDYRESTSALSDDSHEVFGAVSVPLNEQLNFTLYGTGGLSDGAPDYGVGGMVTFKF